MQCQEKSVMITYPLRHGRSHVSQCAEAHCAFLKYNHLWQGRQQACCCPASSSIQVSMTGVDLQKLNSPISFSWQLASTGPGTISVPVKGSNKPHKRKVPAMSKNFAWMQLE